MFTVKLALGMAAVAVIVILLSTAGLSRSGDGAPSPAQEQALAAVERRIEQRLRSHLLAQVNDMTPGFKDKVCVCVCVCVCAYVCLCLSGTPLTVSLTLLRFAVCRRSRQSFNWTRNTRSASWSRGVPDLWGPTSWTC